MNPFHAPVEQGSFNGLKMTTDTISRQGQSKFMTMPMSFVTILKTPKEQTLPKGWGKKGKIPAKN